jgi:NADH-quinone oxidoreductase subunit M
VLLAGLLLKVGGYGFITINLFLFPFASVYFNSFIYIIGIIGFIYASLTILRQIDLKKIIAYSSIAHMNFVMLGLFSLTNQGISGAIFLMISHGILSSALFICVGILYERFSTRDINYFGGLAQIMPKFTSFFFYLILLILVFRVQVVL